MIKVGTRSQQFLYSHALIVAVSVTCWLLTPLLGYHVVAFILLVTVSLVAVSFDILPVLSAAALSALIWDYFFIPPRFTLQVNSTEDLILLLMYFLIAIVGAVLTYRIRKIERREREKEEKAQTVKLYNTLLNSLSHELRTPLATIIGATDNLQQQSARLSALQRHELLAEIAKASFRLNRQVDNLLSMSRLEAGFVQPKKDWCDINELIYETVKRLEEVQPGRQVHINVSQSIPLCRLDRGLLEQILYNLLINAVTYSQADARIDITARCHADLLEIVVEDDGPGFLQAELPKAFDRFFRGEKVTTGGTGLGLSIVKGFTEAMKGTVQLNNKSTGGAQFTITIPVETSYLKNLKNE